MKKTSSKTTAQNLESRFDAGKSVLDYFDKSRAVFSHGGARAGAGRPKLGKRPKLIKLSPQAVKRFEAYAARQRLGSFSAAVEAASLLVAGR